MNNFFKNKDLYKNRLSNLLFALTLFLSIIKISSCGKVKQALIGESHLSSLQTLKRLHVGSPGWVFEIPDRYLNGILVTRNHLAYLKNRQKYNESDIFDKKSKNLAFYEDKQVIQLIGHCLNCYEKLKPRIELIPKGTKFKILNEFTHTMIDITNFMDSTTYPFFYFILEDVDTKQKFEVDQFVLDDIIKGSRGLTNDKELYENIDQHIKQITQNKKSEIKYCFNVFKFDKEKIKALINEFNLRNEVSYDFKRIKSNKRHQRCIKMKFKSTGAYLTFRRQYDGWIKRK